MEKTLCVNAFDGNILKTNLTKTKILHRFDAVSYTHLDVYKRQGLQWWLRGELLFAYVVGTSRTPIVYMQWLNSIDLLWWFKCDFHVDSYWHYTWAKFIRCFKVKYNFPQLPAPRQTATKHTSDLWTPHTLRLMLRYLWD